MGSGSLDCLMQGTRSFPPPQSILESAHVCSVDQYEEMYRRSIDDSDAFWLDQAQSLEWMQFPAVARKYEWKENISHSWFEDGQLNVSVNCLDRHLKDRGDKIAILWQGDEVSENTAFTYRELHEAVCRFANVLKSHGVKKGDRVSVYLPMIPEAAVAMLACARIGAIHSVVFAGFSAEALMHRIQDCDSKVLITANVGVRGGKTIPLKAIADEAAAHCPTIETVLVVKRTEDYCPMGAKDVWVGDSLARASADCPPERMHAEDPLFILYTSGSTGKPKGVVHTQAGYLLHTALSHKMIFDIQKKDVYWCTADVGWITGHSYMIYGPLANGCTTLLFEGTPLYPDPGRFWEIVDRYQVTILYTAPTVIRTLISKGDEIPAKYNLNSLRILGSVGEPINPEAWSWYHTTIGKEKCPIVDTWWQTETGGILITPLPGAHTLKPGSASRPFFGVEPIILRDDGTECGPQEGGSLCIKKPWPGMMRTMWKDQERFVRTYFSPFKNLYFTGDGCTIDADGDYWLLGRMDDVVNVSGHRIGTAEVESALVSFPSIAEAAVVPIPHPLKGQGLHAFIILLEGTIPSPALKKEILQHIRKVISPIAVPDEIQFTDSLPKTRSGKIMRRLLRKIAEGKTDDLGDTSTLADAKILQKLIETQVEK